MKKYIGLLLIFNFCLVSLFAQDTIYNFRTEQDELIWQKVYETQSSFDELLSYVQNNGVLESISVTNNKITGDLKPFEVDYKGAGYSRGFTPIYLLSNLFTGYVVIEFKESRYRVTISKIMLEQLYSNGLSQMGEKETLNTFAIKKGKNTMKDIFKGSASKIVDYNFNKLFTIKKQDDNW